MKGARTPLFLVGATGTGKSAAAMELARAHPGQLAILAMDAMQVYCGANIGTGKPTAAERAEVPHGGIDLVDFGASFNVAQYLKHAAAFLYEQREARRRVIIVGGTGLYFRALTQGLCEAPQGSDELRAELSSLSVEELQKRLKQIDPAMLEGIDVSNPRRLVRAIEVMESTGRSLREWQEETPEPLMRNFTAFWIQREKAELSQRIEARVETMFSQGWVEEVRGLVERHGAEAVRGFPGIGYGEIAKAMELRGHVRSQVHLGNEGRESHAELILRQAQDDGGRKKDPGAGPAPTTLESLKSDILVATRQYAKRQLTWFAREPNLQAVMLTGNQVLRTAVLPDLL